jgi:hypothetical protein
MEIRPVGAEFFHAERRKGMTKIKVAFRSFANTNSINHTTVTYQVYQDHFTDPVYFISSYITLVGRPFGRPKR